MPAVPGCLQTACQNRWGDSGSAGAGLAVASQDLALVQLSQAWWSLCRREDESPGVFPWLFRVPVEGVGYFAHCPRTSPSVRPVRVARGSPAMCRKVGTGPSSTEDD